MQGSPDKNPELYDLSTVAVAVFSDAPETLRQRASLKRAGATDISHLSSEGLKSITQQKIAVIFDAKTDSQTIQEKVCLFETFIEANPEASVRFFLLYWPEDVSQMMPIPDIFHSGERFECLDIESIGSREVPAYVNKVLYKSRLPFFLRQGYFVAISDILENFDGVNFRPITVRSSEYKSERLYIHNKRLYQRTPEDTMQEITQEEDYVVMKKNSSKHSGPLPLKKLKTDEE